VLFDVPLYPITDRELAGLGHAEQVRQLIAGGAKLIQLREKKLPAGKFFSEAREALELSRKEGARIIINDRVDLALALGADGVHLGQDDLPPAAARRLLGNKAIIGFSTHNLKQALEGLKLPINYLAAGPIFPTSSKSNPDSPIGLKGLRQIRAAIGAFPLVAIGGITAANAADVIGAGADAVAVISDLVNAPTDITSRTGSLLGKLKEPTTRV